MIGFEYKKRFKKRDLKSKTEATVRSRTSRRNYADFRIKNFGGNNCLRKFINSVCQKILASPTLKNNREPCLYYFSFRTFFDNGDMGTLNDLLDFNNYLIEFCNVYFYDGHIVRLNDPLEVINL